MTNENRTALTDEQFVAAIVAGVKANKTALDVSNEMGYGEDEKNPGRPSGSFTARKSQISRRAFAVTSQFKLVPKGKKESEIVRGDELISRLRGADVEVDGSNLFPTRQQVADGVDPFATYATALGLKEISVEAEGFKLPNFPKGNGGGVARKNNSDFANALSDLMNSVD